MNKIYDWWTIQVSKLVRVKKYRFADTFKATKYLDSIAFQENQQSLRNNIPPEQIQRDLVNVCEIASRYPDSLEALKLIDESVETAEGDLSHHIRILLAELKGSRKRRDIHDLRQRIRNHFPMTPRNIEGVPGQSAGIDPDTSDRRYDG